MANLPDAFANYCLDDRVSVQTHVRPADRLQRLLNISWRSREPVGRLGAFSNTFFQRPIYQSILEHHKNQRIESFVWISRANFARTNVQ